MDEAVVLIMAMRNSNMPKFLIEDAALFTAIVSDLFPATDVPEHVSTGPLLQLESSFQPCVVPSIAFRWRQLGDPMLLILTLAKYGQGIQGPHILFVVLPPHTVDMALRLLDWQVLYVETVCVGFSMPNKAYALFCSH